jgi:UDP-glucose 4-epimerase
MNILVVGGAGYIGSHMVKLLNDHSHSVIILDNLSTGNRNAVTCGKFIEGDIKDSSLLNILFTENKVDCVMHFASFIQVGESVVVPAKYYENNVIGTINLLNCMVKNNIFNFIFSSSAAIFGTPEKIPIDETHPKIPINPYGKTKLMIEQVLEDYDIAYNLKSISLRYFNAAGADPSGEIGERHDPETHLIPLILRVAKGNLESISVFGSDYETKDGTCSRDYVHVVDICEAHLLSLDYLMREKISDAFNLGNNIGYTVLEVIDSVKKVTNKNIKIIMKERRIGDPDILIANSSKAKDILRWHPKYSNLDTIVEHAWKWEQ